MAFPTIPPIPRSLFPAPLRRQCRALLAEYLPSPTPLFNSLEQRIPQPARQLAVELPLNQLFADAISDGEFEVLEGRTLRLELDGGFPGVTLGYWQGRFRQVEGRGEATIRGSLKAFRLLAERKVDPDQLFFQRRLVIEGDTELGLTLKNLLDGLEWSLPRLPKAPWH